VLFAVHLLACVKNHSRHINMPLFDQPLTHFQASTKSVSRTIDTPEKAHHIKYQDNIQLFSTSLPVHLSRIPRTKRSTQLASRRSNTFFTPYSATSNPQPNTQKPRWWVKPRHRCVMSPSVSSPSTTPSAYPANERTVPGTPEKRIAGQPNNYQEKMAMYSQQAAINRQQYSGGKAAGETQEVEELSEEEKKERERLKKDWPSQYAMEEAGRKRDAR